MTSIRMYDAQGVSRDNMVLAEMLTKKTENLASFGVAVRVLMQNWRQGTVACKARGDVSFSNRKPWKQKGTGRARAGTPRSPLWRKGGVTFGPQPRTRTLSFNKKQRSLVFNNLFFDRFENDRIICLDVPESHDKPNTKQAAQLLKQLNVYGERVVLFLPWDDTSTQFSFRNIPTVALLSFDQPNIYDLSIATHWIFLKKDVELFNKMISQWN